MNLKAFKRRFGGDLYNELRRFQSIKGYETDNQLEKVLLNKGSFLTKQYFCGNHFSAQQKNDFLKNLYNVLCTLYTDKIEPKRFNFGGIFISKPLEKTHQTLFASEAYDYLIYYLIDDSAFCDAVIKEGPYEIVGVQIAPNDIVIDCGANMGIFSAIASNRGATVYAFEPSGYVIENYLSKTALWNPNIHVCKYALSNAVEELGFIQYMDNIADSSLEMTCQKKKREHKTIQVRATSLDTFVHENNIPRVDFIKADIEGAERYMLMGAKNALKEFAPKIAICTYHLPDDPKVLRELILDANPNYVIEERFKKMYAYVPNIRG